MRIYSKRLIAGLSVFLLISLVMTLFLFDSKADFEDTSCNSIEFNIDESVISNIYKAVAKELENDKDVRTLLALISNQVMNSSNVGSVIGVKI